MLGRTAQNSLIGVRRGAFVAIFGLPLPASRSGPVKSMPETSITPSKFEASALHKKKLKKKNHCVGTPRTAWGRRERLCGAVTMEGGPHMYTIFSQQSLMVVDCVKAASRQQGGQNCRGKKTSGGCRCLQVLYNLPMLAGGQQADVIHRH
jgi:hypothetical protein